MPPLPMVMQVIIDRRAARLALLLTGVLVSGVVRAHGEAGGGPACQLRLGAWRVDVALYQPALHDGEMYCDALPGPGATLLVFDVVDAALTAMPLEVRVLRADGDSSEAAVAAGHAAAIEACRAWRASRRPCPSTAAWCCATRSSARAPTSPCCARRR